MAPPGEPITPISSGEPTSIGDRLAPAIGLARGLIGKIKWLAIVGFTSALFLWIVLFYPFSGLIVVWKAVLAGIVLVTLILPGTILSLVWLGLGEILHLPEKLIEHADTGRQQSHQLVQVAFDKETRAKTSVRHLYGSLTGLRDSLLGSKALLFQAAATARLINPFFLIASAVAATLSFLLVAAALITTLVLIF